MVEQFKAVLLRTCNGAARGTIVDAMAGGDGFEGRWRILLPVDLAGTWLVPLVDADRAISILEATHILSYRRGPNWNVKRTTTLSYIHRGLLGPAGHGSPYPGRVPAGRWFVSLRATWQMPFPQTGRHLPKKQEAV